MTTVPPSGYTVRGNKIYDANNNVHLFRGIARPSLEWNSQGEGLSLADYKVMAGLDPAPSKGWSANVIRLSLSEKFWLQNTSGYQATIAQQVAWITRPPPDGIGKDVILDLHWSVGGNLANDHKQYRMADLQSITFWQQVAARYKDNPKVLFELYNEPHDVPWTVWRNGGSSGEGYTAAGMQQLYKAVRDTGATNLVIVGGLNWAYDLSEIPTYKLTGTNIVYNTHPYEVDGKLAGNWNSGFGNLSATSPVIMTEFGNWDCNGPYYTDLLNYAQSHGIHWTAWAWMNPLDCGFPTILADWNGTPSAIGQIIKNHM